MSPKPGQQVVQGKSGPGFMQCMRKLHEDMTMLYETGKHSDLTIICKGVEFRVHRAILLPRSDFFRACCDSGFKESQENVVTLPDDDPVAMKMALREIYTRYPSTVKDHYEANEDANFETLIETWKLADKYELPDLTMQCLLFIENLPTANLLRARSGDDWIEDLIRGLSKTQGLLDSNDDRQANIRTREAIFDLLLRSITVSSMHLEEAAGLKNDPEVLFQFLKYVTRKYSEAKGSS